MNNRTNKFLILIVFSLFIIVLFMPSVLADTNIDYSHLCSDEGIKATMKILGYIIFIIKILVPLVIIILGIIDFSKAIVSSDDKAISTATSSLIMRFVAGIIIFFIPTIVKTLFNVIDMSLESDSDMYACISCMLDTDTCD